MKSISASITPETDFGAASKRNH